MCENSASDAKPGTAIATARHSVGNCSCTTGVACSASAPPASAAPRAAASSGSGTNIGRNPDSATMTSATSGICAVPPTHHNPATVAGSTSAAATASRTRPAARTSTGRAACSTTRWLSTTAGPDGTGTVTAGCPARACFAARRLAASAQPCPAGIPAGASAAAKAASMASPPASESARVDSTSKPTGLRRSTLTSAPPPRSHTTTTEPTGTCTPPASACEATATGASTNRGCGRPARCAACRSHVRRRGPHPAGTTSRTSSTASPATR